MKVADVKVGATYMVRVSGNLVPVVVTGTRPGRGWAGSPRRFLGVNRATSKVVEFTAAKCRREWTDEEVTKYLSDQIERLHNKDLGGGQTS